LGWDGLSWAKNNGHYKPEANDMDLGVKAYLVEQNGVLPSLGLPGSLSLPTRSGDFTSKRVDPTGGLLWRYNVAAGAELFGTVLMSSITDERGRFFEAANAVGVSFPLSQRLARLSNTSDSTGKVAGAAHTLNGGFTYLLTDNLQFDINGGAGTNSRADDSFIGTGLAFRF
jgi:hypothetical protein